jgi:hypothetical protein
LYFAVTDLLWTSQHKPNKLIFRFYQVIAFVKVFSYVVTTGKRAQKGLGSLLQLTLLLLPLPQPLPLQLFLLLLLHQLLQMLLPGYILIIEFRSAY